ncbi:SGNH/GDSL hydrolase family protein [Motilibacter deserti]|uniref:SGNH hydrolase-type esterase domain-containing protein n=1 Tax=Motilibacter deserti TaxID=2714956 RepID=A0ABX0GRF0_9ACTN|nr:SGNH/GDSL hydrolase family protein [Motilibacter deserti]NHC13437.1 hypothetical protein [Motilibacter deserti]
METILTRRRVLGLAATGMGGSWPLSATPASAEPSAGFSSAAVGASSISRYPTSVVLLGDSITDKNLYIHPNVFTAYQDEGFWTWAAIRLRQRARLVGVFGYSGQRTDYIASKAAEALATGAGWLVEEGGTNDLTGGVSAEDIIANKIAIWTQAQEAGARVVATTIIPQSSWSPSQRMQAQRVNEWIRSQAHELGVLPCSWDVPITDPGTGDALSGSIRADGLHPTATGAAAMGRRLATLLEGVIPPGDILGTGGDATNLLPNSAMTGNRSGLATGWTLKNASNGVTAAAASKVARQDDLPGEWQQIKVAAGDTSGISLYRVITSGFSAGDSLYARWEFERDNDWAALPASGANQFRLRVYCLGVDRAVYGLNHVGPEAPSAASVPSSGVLATPPLVVPEGTTALVFGVEFRGQGTLRLGRGELRMTLPSS